jgi:hypothetical protein
MDPRHIFFYCPCARWDERFSGLSRIRIFFRSPISIIANRSGQPEHRQCQTGEAVKSVLASDEQVRRADLSGRADVTKNEVPLSGIVESEAVRERARGAGKDRACWSRSQQ